MYICFNPHKAYKYVLKGYKKEKNPPAVFIKPLTYSDAQEKMIEATEIFKIEDKKERELKLKEHSDKVFNDHVTGCENFVNDSLEIITNVNELCQVIDYRTYSEIIMAIENNSKLSEGLAKN